MSEVNPQARAVAQLFDAATSAEWTPESNTEFVAALDEARDVLSSGGLAGVLWTIFARMATGRGTTELERRALGLDGADKEIETC